MSTTFLRTATLCVMLGACAHLPHSVYEVLPAPPDTSDSLDVSGRSWEKVRVSDAYGSFEMRVPMVRITRVPGTPTLVIDSIALQQIEKRLTARVARVARAEAAAVHGDTLTHPVSVHEPAPAIQPGLLGTITFRNDTTELSPAARQRVAAIAQLARELPGGLEVTAWIDGTGPALLDAALVRARRTYLAIVAAQPELAERAVTFSITTRAGPPDPAATTTSVSIFASSQR